MPVKIERLNDDKCLLTEAPFWDADTQSVYFVDALGKTVNRYTPSTGAYVKALVGDKHVAFIIPIENAKDTFLIGYGNELAKLKWDGIGNKIQGIETVVSLGEKHHFNDSKVDPLGILWTGTYVSQGIGKFSPKEGSLFTMTAEKKLSVHLTDITLSNGLAWNENIKKFYYVDSIPGVVYSFDYSGTAISNQQVIFKFPDRDSGLPDGMTIDLDGNLWIAVFGGSKIIKIDPSKPNTVLQTIEMPVKQVTCVQFGGANYDELYVTTAGIAIDDAPAPQGGWVYRITGLDVKGAAARRVTL